MLNKTENMNMNMNQVYKLQFSEAYHTQFAIPEYLLDKLSLYKMLKWDARFFLAKWEKNIGTYAAGTIRRYDELFHVSFCSGISLGMLKQMLASNPEAEISLVLSFRKSPKLPAYVLVAFAKEAL